MAITRIFHMKECRKNPSSHLKNGIEYIINPEKTDDGKYIGYGNCRPEHVYQDMMETKEFYQKKDGRQGYHFVLSFDAAEVQVDEEFAMKIIREFAEKYLGRDYQYVYAVHNDRIHMHAHLIFNSVKITDGLKYHYQKGDWERYIQPITDEICKKYELKTILLDGENDKEKENKSWKDIIEDDLKEAISDSISYLQFKEHLQKKGYQIKDNKYLSICPPGKKQFVRTQQLGPGYEKNNLLVYFKNLTVEDKKQIENLNENVNCSADWNKIKFDKEDFYIQDPQMKQQYYLNRNDRKKLRTSRDRQSWKYKKDIREVQQLIARQEYLDKMKISSGQELIKREEYIRRINKELTEKKIECYQKRYPYKDLIKRYEEFLNYMDAAGAYRNGNLEFKKEFDYVNQIIAEFTSNGYTVADVKQLYDKYQKPLLMIHQKKKYIANEIKIINQIKGEDRKIS